VTENVKLAAPFFYYFLLYIVGSFDLNLTEKVRLIVGTMPAKKCWPSLSVNSKKNIVIRTLLSS
jgi:hypothetical protein